MTKVGQVSTSKSWGSPESAHLDSAPMEGKTGGRFYVSDETIVVGCAGFQPNKNSGVQSLHSARTLKWLNYVAVLRPLSFALVVAFLSRFVPNSLATSFCSFSVSTR